MVHVSMRSPSAHEDHPRQARPAGDGAAVGGAGLPFDRLGRGLVEGGGEGVAAELQVGDQLGQALLQRLRRNQRGERRRNNGAKKKTGPKAWFFSTNI